MPSGFQCRNCLVLKALKAWRPNDTSWLYFAAHGRIGINMGWLVSVATHKKTVRFVSSNETITSNYLGLVSTDTINSGQLLAKARRRDQTPKPFLPFANFPQRHARRLQVSSMLVVTSLKPDCGKAHPGFCFRVDIGRVFGHQTA